MKYRNVSDRTLAVEATPGVTREIEPDGVVEVPDADERAWAETLWQPVASKKTEKKDD